MIGALNTQPTLRGVSAPTSKPAPAATEAPQSPVDSLPDLSTIETRVGENAPAAHAPEISTGISGTKKAILATVGLATAGAALFGAAPQAHAGGRHNGYNRGYGGNHRHHGGGNNNAGAVIGGIILGAIIGGAIADQAPPVYYPPTYPQYPQQQVQQPFYDNYGRLICPNSQGGWYVSADQYQCRSSRW
ncbi:hypothetical protein IV102_26575 [bacterium]|nr:hypothetical protein [bacterium]